MDIKMIDDKVAIKSLKKFMDAYLERGLGGYSGKELELLVLELMIDLYPDFEELPVFDKSRLLKASDTKIKNMLYEIKLRRDDDHKDLIKHIESNIESVEMQKGKLIIELDDVYAMKKMKSMLKKSGFISDSSFNSDLMKVPFAGFVSVVAELYQDKAGQKNFEDLMAAKDLAEANKAIIDTLKIPGTEFGVTTLWDLATKTGKSVTAFISKKSTEAEKKEQEKIEEKNKKKSK